MAIRRASACAQTSKEFNGGNDSPRLAQPEATDGPTARVSMTREHVQASLMTNFPTLSCTKTDPMGAKKLATSRQWTANTLWMFL